MAKGVNPPVINMSNKGRGGATNYSYRVENFNPSPFVAGCGLTSRYIF